MLAGDTSAPGYRGAEGDVRPGATTGGPTRSKPHRIANYRTVAYQKTVVHEVLWTT